MTYLQKILKVKYQALTNSNLTKQLKNWPQMMIRVKIQ